MTLPEPPPLPAIRTNDLLPLFCRKLEAAAASFAMAQSKSEIREQIQKYLATISILEKPSFDDAAARLLGEAPRDLTPEDKIRVTLAGCGIAETGTLIFTGDGIHPSLSHFLPEIEIAILPRSCLRAHLEQALEEMPRPLPRGLFCVTGPSRSADIEQTLLMGAHGPRFLHVIVWEDEKAA